MKSSIQTVFSSLALMTTFQASYAEVIPGTNFSVDFESANIVGSGRNINMNRVPVINVNTGESTLFDVAFKFTYTPTDGLLFEQISSAAISPPTAIANISPGVYQSQGGICYMLDGPTFVDANRSLYTIRGVSNDAAQSCDNTKDAFTAQFISGPASGHPDIGDREIVPSLSDTFTYGIIASHGSTAFRQISTDWEQNELIGIRQSGDQLILGLFSEGVDNNGAPVDFKDMVKSAILTKINP